MDFYFLHCTNSSIFFPTFNAQTCLSPSNKARLLKLKGYMDLAMYASRRSPPLLLEEITTYVPKRLEAGEAEWKGIFQRLFEYEDDGHAVKLGRAVANGEAICGKWESEKWAKVKGWMWEKIGNMVIDSVEDEGKSWVRSAGFDEAWEDFVDRPGRENL
jgi:hypothetical protein